MGAVTSIISRDSKTSGAKPKDQILSSKPPADRIHCSNVMSCVRTQPLRNDLRALSRVGQPATLPINNYNGQRQISSKVPAEVNTQHVSLSSHALSKCDTKIPSNSMQTVAKQITGTDYYSRKNCSSSSLAIDVLEDKYLTDYYRMRAQGIVNQDNTRSHEKAAFKQPSINNHALNSLQVNKLDLPLSKLSIKSCEQPEEAVHINAGTVSKPKINAVDLSNLSADLPLTLKKTFLPTSTSSVESYKPISKTVLPVKITVQKPANKNRTCDLCRTNHLTFEDIKKSSNGNTKSFSYSFSFNSPIDYCLTLEQALRDEKNYCLENVWPQCLQVTENLTFYEPNNARNFQVVARILKTCPVKEKDSWVAMTSYEKSGLYKLYNVPDIPCKRDFRLIDVECFDFCKKFIICKVTSIVEDTLHTNELVMTLKCVGSGFLGDSPIDTQIMLVPYRRMECALLSFASATSFTVSPDKNTHMMSELLTARKFNLPSPYWVTNQDYTGNVKLNQQQNLAFVNAFNSHISLIQGPPGTGKTTVSAVIAASALKFYPDRKVLVTGTSNQAVDNMLLRIKTLYPHLRCIRMLSKTKERLPNSALSKEILRDCLHYRAFRRNPWIMSKSQEWQNRELSTHNIGKFSKLFAHLEHEILREEADIICVTQITAGDCRLRGLKFSTLIVDEATQSIEPAVLVPLQLATGLDLHHFIMVGDTCQLGPVVSLNSSSMKVSIYERFILAGFPSIMLNEQYRMHPQLVEFSNSVFYKNQLMNGVTISQRLSVCNPVNMFHHLSHCEQRHTGSTSFANFGEAQLVKSLIDDLVQKGVAEINIGVITPYDGQRRILKPMLSNQVEVNSVDAFQGREKDFIIFTCVRSNSWGNIGFLKDPRRLNVAMTRAKFAMFIVGDANTLIQSGDRMWNALVAHFRKKSRLKRHSDLYRDALDNRYTFSGTEHIPPKIMQTLRDTTYY